MGAKSTAGVTRRRAAFALLAALIAVAATTSLAEGSSGTNAAKRLARAILEHYRHVQFVAEQASGDLIYCPRYNRGYLFGPAGAYPGCNAKARIARVTELSNGREVRQVGHVMARGKPTLTFVAQPSAAYVLDPSRGCWSKHPTGRVSGPLFYFPRNERLRIAGRKGAVAILKGRIPHQVAETNRVNTHTHDILSDRIVHADRTRTTENWSFQTVAAGPAVPSLSPACT